MEPGLRSHPESPSRIFPGPRRFFRWPVVSRSYWNGIRFRTARSDRNRNRATTHQTMAVPTTARAVAQQQKLRDRRLTLEEILRDLVADQLVAREAADALLATKALRKGDAHPLIVVADQKWKDPRRSEERR